MKINLKLFYPKIDDLLSFLHTLILASIAGVSIILSLGRKVSMKFSLVRFFLMVLVVGRTYSTSSSIGSFLIFSAIALSDTASNV